jgi:hypothetical protein
MKISKDQFKWLFIPNVKAIVAIVTTVLTGFFSSALVTQLTNNKGELDWSEIGRKWTFYTICALLVISIIYSITSAVEETNYRKNIDDKLLKKFVENEGLNTLASEINTAFKTGDKSKLNDLMEMKDTFINNLGKK